MWKGEWFSSETKLMFSHLEESAGSERSPCSRMGQGQSCTTWVVARCPSTPSACPCPPAFAPDGDLLWFALQLHLSLLSFPPSSKLTQHVSRSPQHLLCSGARSMGTPRGPVAVIPLALLPVSPWVMLRGRSEPTQGPLSIIRLLSPGA